MKKALLAVIGAGVVASMASLAFADGDAAYSANAVGVVKYSIPAAGGFTCVSLPLHSMEQPNWVWTNTSLATQLGNGYSAYFWQNTRWEQSKKVKGKWNGVGTSKVLAPGEAFFIQSPTNASETQISLLGELPIEDNLSFSVRGKSNFDTRGVTPYPVEMAFTNSVLAQTLVNGSSVFFWVGSRWEQSKKVKGKWNGRGSSYVLGVGEGVFVQSANTDDTITIEEERPFTW